MHIYKAGPCSPLRAAVRAGCLPQGGGKKHHLQRHVCPAPLELRVLLSGHAMLQLSPPQAAGSEKVKHPVILCCLIEETQKGEKKEKMFRVEGQRQQQHTGKQHRALGRVRINGVRENGRRELPSAIHKSGGRMGWQHPAGLPGLPTLLEEGLESKFSSIYFFPFFFFSLSRPKKKNQDKTNKKNRKKKRKTKKTKPKKNQGVEARAGPRRQTMGLERERRGSRQTRDGRFTLHPQRTHWGCPWPFGRTVYWLSVQGAQRPGHGLAVPLGGPWLKVVEASATWGG